jgi:hypothetical protein
LLLSWIRSPGTSSYLLYPPSLIVLLFLLKLKLKKEIGRNCKSLRGNHIRGGEIDLELGSGEGAHILGDSVSCVREMRGMSLMVKGKEGRSHNLSSAINDLRILSLEEREVEDDIGNVTLVSVCTKIDNLHLVLLLGVDIAGNKSRAIKGLSGDCICTAKHQVEFAIIGMTHLYH